MSIPTAPIEMPENEELEVHQPGVSLETSKKRNRYEFEDGYSDLNLKGPSYEPGPVPVDHEVFEMVKLDGSAEKPASSTEDRKDSKQTDSVSVKDFAVSGPSPREAEAARSALHAWVQDLTSAFDSQGENDAMSDTSFTTAKPFPAAHLNESRPTVIDENTSTVGTHDSVSTVKPLNRGAMNAMAPRKFNTHLSPNDSVSQVGLGSSSKGKSPATIPSNPGQTPYRNVPFINPKAPVSSRPPSKHSRHSQRSSQLHAMSMSRRPPNIITTPPSPPARLNMPVIRAQMTARTDSNDAADALRATARQRQAEIETMSA